jgi:hypothetical protein
MTKFIIVNPKNGKAVQSWSFAERKHIIYCSSPEWSMKWDDETSANIRKEYLEENFPGQALIVMKVTINTTYTIG